MMTFLSSVKFDIFVTEFEFRASIDFNNDGLYPVVCDHVVFCYVVGLFFFYVNDFFTYKVDSCQRGVFAAELELRSSLIRTVMQCTVQLFARIQSSLYLPEH